MISEKTINWIYACTTRDVPANGGVCVKYNNEQIALFYFARRNEWYASQNECPHRKQMALSRGMTGSVGDEPKVACPFHKKTFSLITGECLSGDECAIKTYPVKVVAGKIFIGTDETILNTPPLGDGGNKSPEDGSLTGPNDSRISHLKTNQI